MVLNIRFSSMLFIDPAGPLEAITSSPATVVKPIVAIICHPHPLHQGSMHNKVVTTLAKTYDACGLPTIRFNYRGVGKSAGEYGYIEGEIADCLAVYNWAKTNMPDHEIALAGFSFGSFISAALANQHKTHHLISVAPAVNHAPYETLDNIKCPWLIIQGEADEIVPVDKVLTWQQNLVLPHQFELLPGVSHFFHGQLLLLRQSVERFLSKTV